MTEDLPRWALEETDLPAWASGGKRPPPVGMRHGAASPLDEFVTEGAQQLGRIPGELATQVWGNTTQAAAGSQALAQRGVENLKRGNVVSGLSQDILGTLGVAASPLTGAWATASENMEPTGAGLPYEISDMPKWAREAPLAAAEAKRVEPVFTEASRRQIDEPAPATAAANRVEPDLPKWVAEEAEQLAPPVKAASLPERIEEAVVRRAGWPMRDGVRLDDLERDLPDVPREDLHRELTQMFERGDATLMGLDNPRDIERMGDAAVSYKGTKLGTVWLHREPSKAEIPPLGEHAGETPKMSTAGPQAGGAAATPLSALLPAATGPEKIKPVEAMQRLSRSIRAVLSPATLSVDAREAASRIRQAKGQETRAGEQARALLEPYGRLVRALTPDERFGLVRYVESRSETPGWRIADCALQPVADTMREVFGRVRDILESMSSTEDMGFVEDYFPHMWQDLEKARAFARAWVARAGEGGFTKKRSIPTVEDGIRAGLVPRYTDPIETTLRYIENAHAFIAVNRIYDEARDDGYIKYALSGKQPEGWAPLEGRLAHKGYMQAYAPEDFARVFNNTYGRGLSPDTVSIVQAARQGFNLVTAIELAWPGFHFAAMTFEAMTNQMAKAIGEALDLRIGDALKSLGGVPYRPVHALAQGKMVQDVYRGLTRGSKEVEEIVDLLTNANLRVVGKGRAADEYRFSGSDGFHKAIKRGTMLAELNEDLKRIGQQPIAGTAAVIAKNAGRALETSSAYLFEFYIPRLKASAAFDLMGSWLKSNPNASHEEALAWARHVVDVIDARFGEMNQDNIFWSRGLKAGAQMTLLSFSWEMGFFKTIPGGVIDWAKFPFTRQKTARMSYVIALPVMLAILNGVTTYLRTGEAPHGRDWITGRTGGKDPSTGEPERMLLPTWGRNVLGWADALLGDRRGSVAQEVGNMLNPGLKEIWELFHNSDWRGDPIVSPAPNAPPWLKQLMDYVVGQHLPMPLQPSSAPKRGSEVSPLARALGVRPAPFWVTSPDEYEKSNRKRNTREWKSHERFLKRQQELREPGGDPQADLTIHRGPSK